ncbi:MAG: glutathione synthase [Desulfobacteraceae bacterium]|nr:MAG: glutathione synthase [Desulfobacteraceae bacterium]
MILSFHPCFTADKNMICAGRKPGAAELEEIKHAGAVILPQGCREDLYYMARENCKNVFPDYDARFKYPGKTGQILLFQKTETAHPAARIFTSVSSLYDKDGNIIKENLPFTYPFVLKFDWGGEGETVHLIKTQAGLKKVFKKAGEFEKTGQKGFILQEYIESGNRSLRIAVIGQKFISYWRVQKDPDVFCAGLSKGAIMDFDSDPELVRAAGYKVKDFCRKTGINLAGFDFLFSSENYNNEPLFLEINYFFGRKGLGGSEKFYKILNGEIKKWLKSL